ncbi:MAG: ATP-binding protein [Actinomycetota bacterium]
MAVRTRVALVFTAIMALVLAGASVFLLTRLRSQLWAAVDDGLRSRTAILLADVAEDYEVLGTGEAVIDEAEVIAQILDPEGRVLESSRRVGSQPLITGQQAETIDPSQTFDSVVRVDRERQNVRLLATRGTRGTIVIAGTSTDEAQQAIAALTRLLVIGGPVILIVSATAVWALAGVALRPVERLRSEADALSFGIDGRRLPVPSTRDEIARLAETLNRMLERIQRSLERERRFVDDASHELRTPLAVLKTELEIALRRSRSRDELEAAIRSAAEEVDALANLAEHLLILARADRGVLAAKPSRIDVAQLAEQVGEGLARRAEAAGVELRTGPSEPVWADVDPLLVRRAISNLIENALKHTPRGGKVSVLVRDSQGSEILVTDTGPGFDPELLPTVFDPFTQSDGARGRSSGTGLGLAIVRAVTDAHGGTAEAGNRAEGGAAVLLRFPSS